MAVSLGKRKRRSQRTVDEGHSEDEDDMRARFQRAFEAKFRPLEQTSKKPQHQQKDIPESDDGGEHSEASDWSGFDDDDSEEARVVTYSATNDHGQEVDRSQQRAYMSSKPPSLTERPTVDSKTKSTQNEEEDGSEAKNLKNDLALQRLLKESHLLDPSTFSSSGNKNSAPAGKGRLKALDLRLQGLGAKTSLSSQEKMPIAHRKGIASKAVNREDKRRKDAAENGVILERKTRQAGAGPKERRERSVGGPTVGKFRGGTLRLSGRDLKDIQGPQKKAHGKKGRR